MVMCGIAKVLPPGAKIFVGKRGSKPKNCIKSVYVCPGRMATHHVPLTGLAHTAVCANSAM